MSLDFNNDGSKIVSASYDKIRLQDARTGEIIKYQVGHSGSVRTVSFNNDESKIVSASYDNSIRIMLLLV